MLKIKNNRYLSWSLTGIFFGVFFLYFGILNRFHLQYLEENQLFRYNWNYVHELFQKPGGFTDLAGAFLTQFFIHSWVGAFLITLLGLTSFFLTAAILHKHQVKGLLLNLLPAFFILALHSYHNFKLSTSLAWIFVLGIYTGYLYIRNTSLRYVFGMVTAVLLYFLTGGLSLLFVILIALEEVCFRKDTYYLVAALFYLLLGACIPFLAWKFVYYIPFADSWMYAIQFSLPKSYLLFYIPWALYLPLLLGGVFIRSKFTKSPAVNLSWNILNIASGIIVTGIFGYFILRFAYDKKNEAFLRIDHYVQQADWEKVLRLSREYPGTNQIVVYYTNLALYKTGQLPYSMFNYRQTGPNGLWLEWKRNETAPYYGGEIFYHLAYNNEAYRWAFEAMEAKGMNPRSLKRLAITSIVSYNYHLAGKFLHYLDQSMFYRSWAQHYEKYLSDTTLIAQDQEITDKRYYAAHTDFITDISSKDIGFGRLLFNHPDNRMAFEYLMASLLLNKNLPAVVANLSHLKEFGYTAIPTHYEEALILYMGITKKNGIPEGYSISEATQQRFHEYASTFSSYRDAPTMAAKALFNQFGGTFWFYMQFANYSKP